MKYRLEIKNVSFLWSERKYISKAINKHQLQEKQNRKYIKVAQLHLHPVKHLIDIQVRFHYGFPQDCGSGSVRVLGYVKVFWFPTDLADT